MAALRPMASAQWPGGCGPRCARVGWTRLGRAGQACTRVGRTKAGWTRAGWALVLGLWLALLAPAVRAALAPIPALDAPVVDSTDTLGPDTRLALERRAHRLRERSGAQVQVLIVAGTAPEDIADYAQRVFEAWRLGRSGIDDGVLLVLAKDERRARIQVGYGLEGRIPDAAAREIIEQRLAPALRQGDYDGGVDAASRALVALVEGEPLPPLEPASSWRWPRPAPWSAGQGAAALGFGFALAWAGWRRRRQRIAQVLGPAPPPPRPGRSRTERRRAHAEASRARARERARAAPAWAPHSTQATVLTAAVAVLPAAALAWAASGAAAVPMAVLAAALGGLLGHGLAQWRWLRLLAMGVAVQLALAAILASLFRGGAPGPGDLLFAFVCVLLATPLVVGVFAPPIGAWHRSRRGFAIRTAVAAALAWCLWMTVQRLTDGAGVGASGAIALGAVWLFVWAFVFLYDGSGGGPHAAGSGPGHRSDAAPDRSSDSDRSSGGDSGWSGGGGRSGGGGASGSW